MLEDFPFKSSLKLSTIIGYWELQRYSDNPITASTAKKLVEEIDQYPFLRENISDSSLISDHQHLIDVIISAVVPPAVSNDQIVAVFRPFSLDYFYSTAPFRDLIEKAGSLLNMVSDKTPEEIAQTKNMAAYGAILNQFYGVKLPPLEYMTMTLKEDNGLQKYFHVGFDARFCEISLVGEKPELTLEEIDELIQSHDLELWYEKLPPKHFEFTGFSIYSLTEITQEEIIKNLKQNILETTSEDPSFFDYVEEQFRSLVEVPDLRLGISSFHTFKNNYQACGEGGTWSLLVDKDDNFLNAFHEISAEIQQTGRPVIVPEISGSLMFSKDPVPDYRSVIVAPLYSDGEFIGHFEMVSNSESLRAIDFAKIEDILPIFANGMARKMKEVENRISGIIKEHYTSIHPSVEWKFTEAAYKILDQESQGISEAHEEIIFKDVHPLFGSSDIRNSSVQRNNAIVADLTQQLKLAKEVLAEGKKRRDFPIIGEAIYRIAKQITRLKKGLISEDENLIVNFLRQDIEPLIRDLEEDMPDFMEFSAKGYWNKLDPEVGIIYDKRKNFEESLTKINESIASLLEEEQDRAQDIFPHYFERYKTDGVEYNIYVGDSISRNKKFSRLYLKNLRLWQLLITIEISKKTRELKQDLSMPLDVGHLILVHSQPLAVKFRMDEKQFDVDGAYNIRYEIIKKRIDKVRIKDSSERLTQAETISIVYNREEDAREYLTYLEYLAHKGLISPQFEQFVLEELQGVSGLKAFRVRPEKSAEGIVRELERLSVANRPEKRAAS